MAQKGEIGRSGKKDITAVGLGLEVSERRDSIDMLSQLLSDEFALYLKARKYHWNVSGQMFNDLHAFFESLYVELDTIIDEIAERIKQLGGNAEGTMKEYLARTRIPEEPGMYPTDRGMIASLLGGFESVIRDIRENLAGDEEHRDEGTAHFLVDIMVKHEKKTWMLRSVLQGWEEG